MKHFNIYKSKHTQLTSKKTKEEYSESLDVVAWLGLSQVVLHHEILAPNKRASAAHYHSDQEEIMLVIGGRPTLIFGEEVLLLKEGDVVGIKPNEKQLYYMENRSESDASILVIGSKPKNDTVFYS